MIIIDSVKIKKQRKRWSHSPELSSVDPAISTDDQR